MIEILLLSSDLNYRKFILTRKDYDQEKPQIESIVEFKKRIKSVWEDIPNDILNI